jgi:hypothetical protein
MGQFYANLSKYSLETYEKVASRIKIEKIQVKIENNPTVIDESSTTVFKYRTPHFKSI